MRILFFVFFCFCFLTACSTNLPIDTRKAAKLNVELGLNYLEQGDRVRSKEKLNHALKLDPQSSEVLGAYAAFLEKVGEVKTAEVYYRKSIKLNRKNGEAHHHFASFLCRQKRFQQAINEFELAVKDPQYANTAEALENAGLCMLTMPNERLANYYFEKALRYDPKRAAMLREKIQFSKKHT